MPKKPSFVRGPKKTLGRDPRDSGAYFALGESWEVTKAGSGFSLSFVSGEHGGPEKMVSISGEEARLLRDDPSKIGDVLRTHGTG